MDFQKLTAYRNSENHFTARLGIVVEEIGPGWARVTKTVTPEDLNPVGRAHGGCLFAMADTACGSAAVSHGYLTVTLSASYNFLRAGMVGDRITALAREVKHGATISVYDAALTNQNGELVGTASMNFFTLKEKLEL